MIHRDWHIANGIPASRVLDLQSRFGVTSAFLRAIRQLSDSTPSAAPKKETQATVQKRRRSLHQTKRQPSCPHLVTLAYTKSRRRQALVPQYVSVVASELLRGLESSCASPSLEQYLRRRLSPGHSGLRFNMPSEAMRLLRTVLRPWISD